MLSEALKTELRGELDRLRRRRQAILEKIDAKITSIEVLLTDDDESAPAQAHSAVTTASVAVAEGLRPKLRRLLSERPGLTTREITATLEKEGFQVGGTLPLRARVYAETGRMRKEGAIVRDASGGLSMAPR